MLRRIRANVMKISGATRGCQVTAVLAFCGRADFLLGAARNAAPIAIKLGREGIYRIVALCILPLILEISER